MLDIILLILLILGFLIGLKRGFILQLMHLAGFVVAFIVARLYYEDLAGLLELWIPNPNTADEHFWGTLISGSGLVDAFYNGVAFIIIFIIVKILMQVLANMLDFVSNIPILSSINNLLGSIFGLIEMYVIVFVVLFLLSLVSVDFVQDFIQDSSIASFMIENTPLLSDLIKNAWFED
ncbi:CvpA family protein [Alkalibacillus haloalkaliphilus]|uniref:CvpA family protein n=1 Tax=Alkalibacillus haloalkaliphilus TaxID=94136 RepID=UPI00293696A1|nr:CvpA family protein [Alkalibacillus haloalkaliphilus]MDV2581168.1 CvpA family protein [Alkalibacillus haloalkaliphilus]